VVSYIISGVINVVFLPNVLEKVTRDLNSASSGANSYHAASVPPRTAQSPNATERKERQQKKQNARQKKI
jgi:hypothetical protein